MICLNVGAGAHRPDGWISVDSNTDADIRANVVADGLPYETGSVDRIFCSHVLEHIYWDDVPVFLRECRRVLKPDAPVEAAGRMLIVGPDMLRALRQWHDETIPWWLLLATLEGSAASLCDEQFPEPWHGGETIDSGQPEDGYRHRWNCYERRVRFAVEQAGFVSTPFDLDHPHPMLDEWPLISRDTWQFCVIADPVGIV